ncbi:glycosyltransferase [Desertivirga brevis]|uniref:glycosyltransferase n=1 Tax=Desertivirga brevis TaxID=2810310 RepID=UPI001A9743F1|nr:glycosyltransferase [Pedobacter sp. SYSU D00873]
MKILLIHTSYAERGGEDSVFSNEVDLLSEVAEVDTLTFTNTGSTLNVIKKFLLAPWNFEASARLRKKVKEFKPDVIHIHNWHFAASPAIIRAAKGMNIPVVMTLHNYRLLCPSANLFFNGQIFTDSLKKGFPWKAVFKKVYRNSAVQTFWLSFVLQLHRSIGTWRKVDQYIALTDFGKGLFLNSPLRLNQDQVVTKGNFVSDNGYALEGREKHFLYVGRLTKDKGIEVLLEAFSKVDAHLKIIGDGPLKEKVLAAVKDNPRIKYEGLKKHSEISVEMKRATALIFPSVWYEGMPMTILEAFSSATPVIASDLGAMKSLITDCYNGLLFDAGSDPSLKLALEKWQRLDQGEKESYRLNARRTFEQHYTPERNLNSILSIYKKTIDQTYNLNNCNNIKQLALK